MQRVVLERTVLASRLKDLNSKQTLPVEPSLQGKFNRLLVEAAAGTEALRQRRHDAQWAVGQNEPPSVWEQRLQPLAVAVAECQLLQRQMEARGEALSEYHAATLHSR